VLDRTVVKCKCRERIRRCRSTSAISICCEWGRLASGLQTTVLTSVGQDKNIAHIETLNLRGSTERTPCSLVEFSSAEVAHEVMSECSRISIVTTLVGTALCSGSATTATRVKSSWTRSTHQPKRHWNDRAGDCLALHSYLWQSWFRFAGFAGFLCSKMGIVLLGRELQRTMSYHGGNAVTRLSRVGDRREVTAIDMKVRHGCVVDLHGGRERKQFGRVNQFY
jgi:hypothetical protein